MKTKRMLFIALLLSPFLLSSYTSASQFEETMLQQIAKMKEVKSPDDFKSLGVVFKRIALSEQSRWEPYYYASLCEINAALMSNQNSDELADEVDAMLDKALELNGDESEIYCLKSYVAMIRMKVNPQDRYMTEGAKSKTFLEKAVEANPENPRAFMLFGENTLYTPAQFGGGREKAVPYLQKAKALFAQFKSDNPLHPMWGENRNEQYLEMKDPSESK